MEPKRPLFLICLAIAGLIPMVSFYLSGQWILALASLLPVGSMYFVFRSSHSICAHISLAGFTGLGMVGILLHMPIMVFAFATTAALASWDLVLEMQPEYPATANYERQHLLTLGMALGLGMLAAGSLVWIHLQIPFGGMLALGIILLVSLNQVLSYVQKEWGSDC